MILIIVMLVGLIIVWLSWAGSPDRIQWMRDASLNFGTGLIGSVILIILYDKVQKDFDSADKERRLKTAIRQITSKLQWYWIGCFNFLYQEGLSLSEIKPYSSYREYFDEDFFERVKGIDLSSTCYFNPDHPSWLQHFFDMYKSVDAELLRFLSVYELYLDFGLTEAVENLRKSDFMIECGVLQFQQSQNMVKPPIYATEEMINALRRDVESFIVVTSYCNKYMPESGNFYKNIIWYKKLND